MFTHRRFAADAREARIAAVTPQMDELLGFMLQQFTTGNLESQEARDQVSSFFRGGREYYDTLDIDVLERLMEVVIPVAVARNLLSSHRISFNPLEVENWNAFADKYAAIILDA